jgi:hypothetical protein
MKMKIFKALLTVVAIAALFTAFCHAGELSLTRVQGTFAGDGGEFKLSTDDLDFVGGVPALDGVSFQSFCLEHNENVSIGGTYRFEVNTGAVLGGVGGATGGFDPLSPLTAWLYQSFVEGTLIGYDYGSGRGASARALQNAIWYIEDEVSDLTLGAAFHLQAVNANPTGIGRVRVLNLFQGDGHRQDQIFMQAPEPTTIVLLVVALAFLGMAWGGERTHDG